MIAVRMRSTRALAVWNAVDASATPPGLMLSIWRSRIGRNSMQLASNSGAAAISWHKNSCWLCVVWLTGGVLEVEPERMFGYLYLAAPFGRHIQRAFDRAAEDKGKNIMSPVVCKRGVDVRPAPLKLLTLPSQVSENEITSACTGRLACWLMRSWILVVRRISRA